MQFWVNDFAKYLVSKIKQQLSLYPIVAELLEIITKECGKTLTELEEEKNNECRIK